MTTGPDEGALAGRGHLRAAHADREHVIAVLKTAYTQGRLTKDELETRAGQAFASRTYAELAALTADIPADLASAPPADTTPAAAKPASTPARTMARAAVRSGICVLLAVALAEGALLAGNFLLIVAASFALIAASGFFGYGIIDAWQERRSRGQLPQGPGQGPRGSEGRSPGRDPAPPGAGTERNRAGGTRADSRARRPGRERRHAWPRGIPGPLGPRPAGACGAASAS